MIELSDLNLSLELLFVVPLDVSASGDPYGGPVTCSRETTCDGAFDNPSLARPTLTINTSNICVHSCSMTLTVSDDKGLAGVSDASIITIMNRTRCPLNNKGCPHNAAAHPSV
ncbi:MAG: hypothetical protein ACYCYR_11195 [Desulfobulbaceae bacterium]